MVRAGHMAERMAEKVSVIRIFGELPPEEEELAYVLIDPDIEQLISDHPLSGQSTDYEEGIEGIRRESEPYL